MYSIYSQNSPAGPPFVIGVDKDPPERAILRKAGAKAGALVWTLFEIPGTPFLYIKHADSNLYLRFAPREGEPITLAKIDAMDRHFVVQLANLGAGFVAIHNHNASLSVVSKDGRRADGNPIIAMPVNSPPLYARWLFGPPKG